MAKSDTSDTKKRILDALEKSLGVVTDACRIAKVHRDTFYRYKNEDPDFAAKVEEMSEVALDFAESALYKQIKEGVPSSTIFYLKTKGRRRGYVETMNVEQTNRNAVADLTDEELNAEIERLEHIRKAISD
jgi:hypothetical protein